MDVLVDTSVWIDYFRSGEHSSWVDDLLDENRVAINDLILAELVPFLMVRNQKKIIRLLQGIRNLALYIDWNGIIDFQYRCLKNGLNGVGLPDLIIAQNAAQHRCTIYSLDQHFTLIRGILDLP